MTSCSESKHFCLLWIYFRKGNHGLQHKFQSSGLKHSLSSWGRSYSFSLDILKIRQYNFCPCFIFDRSTLAPSCVSLDQLLRCRPLSTNPSVCHWHCMSWKYNSLSSWCYETWSAYELNTRLLFQSYANTCRISHIMMLAKKHTSVLWMCVNVLLTEHVLSVIIFQIFQFATS